MTTVDVPGQANIYAAGFAPPAAPPDPGGGGGGKYPTPIDLTAMGSPAQLTFPAVSGTVSGWAKAGNYNGPDGGHAWGGSTNAPPWGGISGIVDRTATMFLVGVFLGPKGQPSSPPPTLDVTTADSATMALPVLGQQFFVGNGKSLAGAAQSVVVPQGATRLYLGFAEVWGFGDPRRLPGFYSDNGGSLHVEVQAASQRHWTAKDSTVVITPSLAIQADRVADAFFKSTGHTLVLTDGVRTAADQASAILAKIESDGVDAVRALYKNKTLINQIIDAYNKATTNPKRLSAMTAVIQSQINAKQYISLHLTGRAFDVRSTGMSSGDVTAFQAAVKAAGGTIVDETSSGGPHYHVQF
jgi:hypothetical protein